MLEHVIPQSPFLLLPSDLIILNIGTICKSNFYDRVGVMHTAKEQTERGAVLCPRCGGPLTLHGSYPQHVKDEKGERHDG